MALEVRSSLVRLQKRDADTHITGNGDYVDSSQDPSVVNRIPGKVSTTATIYPLIVELQLTTR
jgi:hypothetical protein